MLESRYQCQHIHMWYPAPAYARSFRGCHSINYFISEHQQKKIFLQKMCHTSGTWENLEFDVLICETKLVIPGSFPMWNLDITKWSITYLRSPYIIYICHHIQSICMSHYTHSLCTYTTGKKLEKFVFLRFFFNFVGCAGFLYLKYILSSRYYFGQVISHSTAK